MITTTSDSDYDDDDFRLTRDTTKTIVFDSG
jgi:hypothetical protein